MCPQGQAAILFTKMQYSNFDASSNGENIFIGHKSKARVIWGDIFELSRMFINNQSSPKYLFQPSRRFINNYFSTKSLFEISIIYNWYLDHMMLLAPYLWIKNDTAFKGILKWYLVFCGVVGFGDWSRDKWELVYGFSGYLVLVGIWLVFGFSGFWWVVKG